jgi:predicted enzyme related to lactoylglutathione lyase
LIVKLKITNMNQNIICWFEIYVKDMERAKKFYNAVIGTKFTDIPGAGESPEGMKMAFFSSMENQGVSGALIEMAGAKEGDGHCVNTMVYFPCQDCSVEESRIKGAGGQVNRSKFSIGEYGFCAICVDTEGNPFGLFSME